MTKLLKAYTLLATITLLFLPGSVVAQPDIEKWHLNEMTRVENGYLEKTAGDPYIVFPKIQTPTCSSMAVLLSISFDPIPKRPVLHELFWSTDYLGFGEENKVFFVIHPNQDGSPNRFAVPLSHTAGCRQIRLDFPGYIQARYKISEYDVVPISSLPENIEVMDAYSTLSVKESLKPEVIIPYATKVLAHGPKRLFKDKPFCFFWLSLIVALLFLIRKFARNNQ